jgi:energy-coupling factor transport system substrate-specific component
MASKATMINKRGLAAVLAILIGAALNCLGSLANMAIGSPLFFDSIFTAAAGAIFGPLAGILCAIASHAFLVAAHGWEIDWIFFVPCSMATGAIAGGFGRRRFESALDVALCTALVTAANALLGALIAAYAYGGITTHPSDQLSNGLILFGQSIIAASFWARIPLNLIDKGIAVAAAYGLRRIWKARAAMEENAPP